MQSGEAYIQPPLNLRETSFKFEQSMRLIEDPLWDRVCAEMVSIMGPAALQIRNVQLGVLSSHDKIVDLYCQTEEIAQFIGRYDFLLLGSLQQYFPALKELRINNTDEHP